MQVWSWWGGCWAALEAWYPSSSSSSSSPAEGQGWGRPLGGTWGLGTAAPGDTAAVYLIANNWLGHVAYGEVGVAGGKEGHLAFGWGG